MSSEYKFEMPKKPSEDTEDISPAKTHWQKHRTKYISGGAIVGTAIVGFVAGKHFQRPIIIDFKPVLNNVVNNNVENNLGRVSKIVRDTETGKEWSKIRYLAEEIAREHGISYDSARTRITQHLHGQSDHLFDKVYEIVGLRTDF